MSFQEAEARFRWLQAELAAGRLSPERRWAASCSAWAWPP